MTGKFLSCSSASRHRVSSLGLLSVEVEASAAFFAASYNSTNSFSFSFSIEPNHFLLHENHTKNVKNRKSNKKKYIYIYTKKKNRDLIFRVGNSREWCLLCSAAAVSLVVTRNKRKGEKVERDDTYKQRRIIVC